MITWPGLKPSLRFSSAGSMCTPWALAGVSERRSASRRPVSVRRSAFVNQSFG